MLAYLCVLPARKQLLISRYYSTIGTISIYLYLTCAEKLYKLVMKRVTVSNMESLLFKNYIY